MKDPDPIPSDEALDEAAASWLYERDVGFAAERARAFQVWRRSDPRHEAALRRVEMMRSLLGELPSVRGLIEARVELRESASAEPRVGGLLRFPRIRWVAGIAAALVVGAFVWWAPAPIEFSEETYVTDVEAPRRVALSDGTVVDLNSGSHVSVRFSAGNRRVVLSEGEALFQVAHDADRPFVVVADGVSVRAVGTAFNVRLAAGTIDVLVVEGKVELSKEREAAMGERPERPLVAAGELTRVLRNDRGAIPSAEKVAPDSVRSLLAWQERMMPFMDLSLRELVMQFNRRNATQLVLDDRALGERTFGGRIALDQVDAFVRFLEQSGDIRAERRSTGEIVLRRAR